MKFHARLQYESQSHYFHNFSKDSLIEEVILPFVNGQIIKLKTREGPKLFNMKSANLLKVYKTKEAIKATDDKSIVDKMKEESFNQHDCTYELLAEIQGRNSERGLTSLLQKALLPPKDQIFVVMKFGDELLDSAYSGAYRTVAEEFKLKCIRIDEVPDSGKITDQILEEIAASKYIVCDLTGARPNCYYETGFAHALGKEVILLANKKEKIHFDLAGHRFIQWSTEEDLRKKLRERFSALEGSKSREE